MADYKMMDSCLASMESEEDSNHGSEDEDVTEKNTKETSKVSENLP